MFTTIIFDLSEVYLHGLLGIEEKLAPLVGMSPKEIEPLLRPEELIAFFHGQFTEDQYWATILQRTKWTITIPVLKKLIRENFAEIPGTRDIIEQLRAKGFKLGLLSVHAKEWTDYCNRKFHYHKLFDVVVYSFEIGLSKPDKRCYEIILDKLRADPQQCIFIDDLERNLLPARELGIRTIQFKSAEQVKTELSHLGIL